MTEPLPTDIIASDANPFRLDGRVALVTGGSRGIGKMIASGLIAFGAKVYIAARDRAACEQSASELSKPGGQCIALTADLSTVAGVKALAEELACREEGLDLLVNNAGIAKVSEIEAVSEADWDAVMHINLKAPFFLTQMLLPLLKAAASPEQPSKVINISSVDGFRINAKGAYSYAASKAGLIHLTRILAAHLIDQHVVVSGIAPGPFVSDMNVAARDHGELLARRVPAKRIGLPRDIAGAAVFLASSAGDYVVGDTITVDGGFAHALPTHGHPLT
jgi:NAD(P)-dependent dehydrogenase (short-subunit alcohol dehydrogenase family)